MLTLDDPSALFDAPVGDGDGIRSYQSVWWIPLGLGLALILLELGYRYRAFERIWRVTPAR